MSTPPPPPGSEPAVPPDRQPVSGGSPPPGSGPGVPPDSRTAAGLPPLPPPPGGHAPGAQPPPGYVAYGGAYTGQGAFESTDGLRKATLVLVWVAVASTLLQLAAHTGRRSAWEDPSSTFTDLDDADNFVVAATFLQWSVELAILIVVSIWSLRTLRNSQVLGVQRLKPGLGCGGWYIPVANIIVPFVQLRRAFRWLAVSVTGLMVWQIGFGAMFVGRAMIFGFNGLVEESRDADEVLDALTGQVVAAGIYVVATVVAAIGLTLGARALDAAARERRGTP